MGPHSIVCLVDVGTDIDLYIVDLNGAGSALSCAKLHILKLGFVYGIYPNCILLAYALSNNFTIIVSYSYTE